MLVDENQGEGCLLITLVPVAEASSPVPSQRGEKGLVHTDCACAKLSVDFL